MAGKGFLVRVRLDLHAITCPGVWLCPSGKVALRITSLGSTLESHRVSPIFPLLFHNEFHFEKTFTRLAALTELQQHFEREIVRAELIQWLGPCNRVVVLATFETDLADLLYPVSRCKRLPPGVDVDLLMDPMKPFPGIIAPKIEISTRTVIEEVLGCWSDETRNADSKTIDHEVTHSRRFAYRTVIRQRRVCHNRKQPRTEISEAPRCRCTRSDLLPVRGPNQQPRVVGHCCRATRERYASLRDVHDAPPSRGHRAISAVTRDNDRVKDDCPICSTYQCYFACKHHRDHDYNCER
nr:spermatogenesis-associated protein 6 isoform X3 [Nomia melanderi]